MTLFILISLDRTRSVPGNKDSAPLPKRGSSEWTCTSWTDHLTVHSIHAISITLYLANKVSVAPFLRALLELLNSGRQPLDVNTLDTKLHQKEHVKQKRELKMKYRKMYWMLERNSKLTVYNKLLIYKQLLKPIWIYIVQLCGCTRPTNIDIIQRLQNKIVRSSNFPRARWSTQHARILRTTRKFSSAQKFNF